MSRRRTTLLAFTVAAATATVVGCGGSGGEAASTALTVSKAEFVRQANAACRQERAGLSARVEEYERRREGRTPAPGADMVHFVYLPTMEAQTERLRQLDMPPGQEERIEEMIDAEQYAIDRVAVISRVPSIAVAARDFAEADRLFHAYGLDACATGSARG